VYIDNKGIEFWSFFKAYLGLSWSCVGKKNSIKDLSYVVFDAIRQVWWRSN